MDGAVLEANAVVVAMGPWSVMAAGWMVLPAVYGRRSPSLIYDTGRDIPAEALFLEYQDETGGAAMVEVFPRANGLTLLTAFSDEPSLPIDPAVVTQTRTGRSPSDYRRTVVAGAASGQDHRPAILLSPDHPRRPAVDRQSAADLRGNRSWPMGYPPRARNRRSLSRANRRRRLPYHRLETLRTCAAPSSRLVAAACGLASLLSFGRLPVPCSLARQSARSWADVNGHKLGT
ncbi:hypothetical protein ABIE49_000004 [Bradyrhizobium sp. OAE829]